MTESSHPLGYQCEFLDSVLDNFYCKKCSLVARRLTFTSCCGESYCHACIADIQQQHKPCPECGQQNFTTMKPLKYQQQMNCLKVSCIMRGRGCGWSGLLGQLDAHLDPEQNNCQHVDIKCPLHCQKSIPRNKVEQHVTRECFKRDHMCQYCDFKASYEVVVDTHWPQCIYFPLQCPNLCGVTCKRDVMKDHMRTCRLEEVACEFSGMGFDGRFGREDQEKHNRQNDNLHFTTTATAAIRMDQLQYKLQQQEEDREEQEEKLQEQEEKLQEQEVKLQEQEVKLQEHEKRFQELERKFQKEKQKTEKESQKKTQKLQEQKKKFEKFENKFEELEQRFHKLLQERDKKLVDLQEKSDQNEVAVKEVTNFISLKRTFAMENFSKEKKTNKPRDWTSPAMYTHVCGYKFCIGIDANGWNDARGKAMTVYLLAVQGEYDHQLKWPAQASFTIELLNQHGGENIIDTLTKIEWGEPTPTRPDECMCSFGRIVIGRYWAFLELKDFLANDTLYFCLSNIAVY